MHAAPSSGRSARGKLAEIATERQRVPEPRRNRDRIGPFPPCIMPLAVSRPDLELAVVGARVMGRGIAQIAAQAGIRVLLHDNRPGAARDAKESVSGQLARLAEKGPLDRDAVARAKEALAGLALRFGHRPVRAKDTPGFIVNHAGRGYGTEALRIFGEGIAEFHEIDRILRDCAGFRLGPFELFDLTGLDVSHPVMESIYRQYYEEPRYRPSPRTGQRLNAGLLGRKSGRGFYRHENGSQEAIPEAPAPSARPATVWVGRSGLAAGLTALLRGLGAHIDRGVP